MVFVTVTILQAFTKGWKGGQYVKLMFNKVSFANYKGTGSFALPTYRVFYEFIPQNPQWNMERRAVNLIVRRIIGDDCFEW